MEPEARKRTSSLSTPHRSRHQVNNDPVHDDNSDPDHDDHQLPQSHLDQGGGRVSGPGALGNIVQRRERGEHLCLSSSFQ